MSNMKFWGTEVKAGEPFKFQPEEGMMLHLSQASLGEVKKDKGNELVLLYVNVDGKKIVLGTLSTEKCSQISYDLVFEDEFELSHNWKNGSVYFVGYKAAMGLDESDDEGFGYGSDSEEDEAPRLAAANGKPKPKDEKPKASTDMAKVVKPETSAAKPNAKNAKLVKNDKPKVSDDEDEDDDSDDSDDDDLEEDDSDDEDMLEAEGDSDEDESSDEEDEPTPKDASKKRPAKSAIKTPLPEKKAKLVTPQKSGGEGKKGSTHTATPHPSKQAGKSNADKSKQQTPKSGGSHGCKSCTKTFNSDGALQSHSKAKHQ